MPPAIGDHAKEDVQMLVAFKWYFMRETGPVLVVDVVTTTYVHDGVGRGGALPAPTSWFDKICLDGAAH